MTDFKVGDQVRIVGYPSNYPYMSAQVGKVGKITNIYDNNFDSKGRLYKYAVKLDSDMTHYAWPVDCVAALGKFAPGTVVLDKHNTEFKVINYDDSGLVRVEDEDGETVLPESELTGKDQ